MKTPPTTSRLRARETASAAALLFLLASLAGCASAPSPAAPVAAPAASSAETNTITVGGKALHKGDTAEQLLAAIGEPDQRKPFRPDAISAEVWIYTRRVPGAVRQVPSSTRDVPYVDPVTGTMRTIQETVFTNERTTIEERTELLLINGQLTEWKQRLNETRTHD